MNRLLFVALLLTGCVLPSNSVPESNPAQFRVWVFGDAHVGTDIEHNRESLGGAIRQSEQGDDKGGPAFDWDIAIALGDFTGGFGVPNDNEGQEVVRQFGALKLHRREDVYSIAGNHDATHGGNRWLKITRMRSSFRRITTC